MSLLELEAVAIDLPVAGRLRRVIHEVSLALDEGEAVGLVGESGAGKSLTSRAVIRLLPRGAALHGGIVLGGRPVTAMSGDELRSYRSRDVA
ncbi:MAG TPA: ATP-binding cassette domain-containing protein, partial [Acidimicrobiales bacterium]|nr:ATP-binding cassette domain-containing protein [Acidimicrobiales bacterium]